MARGSVIKRCKICRREGKSGFGRCTHKEAEYIVVYRINNKQKWETVSTNKKDAERKLAEIVSSINNGTYAKPTEITFGEFSQKWLEDYARARVKDSTYRSYNNAIKCHLVSAFGDCSLSSINQHKIQSLISKILKERKPKTVNNILIQLKTMFKYAKRWGYIRENPAQDIEKVRVEHKEMDFLRPDEIKLLLKQSTEPYKTIFLTAVLTGMRRGELLALQWGDVDWNSDTIFIRRSIYWYTHKEIGEKEKRWQFISPKSKRSIRAIVMSPKLKEALEIHRLSASVSPYDLVFCNKEGQPLDPDNMVKREFIPTLSFAGLRKVCFHSLRHSYASLLIAQSENIKFIQSQLGHASVQTTLDRYGHLLPVNQYGVGSKIDKQIFGVSANTRLTKQPQTSQNTTKQEQEDLSATIASK